MKTKNLLLLFIAIAVASLTVAFTNKSSDGASFVIIRTVEKPSGAMMQKSALAVYQDGVVTEHVELEDLNGKSIDGNLKIIGDLILKFKTQGYEIKAVTGAGATNSLAFTYFLEKK